MTKSHAFAGFTLIEMIMVITITGIIAAAVAVFIRHPVQGYVDSVRRAELTDAADVALRRMTRDVRLALPNSLRTVTNGFEFIMTKSGGRYRDPTDGSNCATANCISFTDALVKTFDILGTSPTNPPEIANGDFVVIYNLGPGHAPSDAYSATAQKNITAVTVTAGTPYTITMGTNVFASQIPPLPSPSARFQVVGAADKVVRYECTGGIMTRYSGCDFANTASGCTAAVLAGSAMTPATCTIDYASAATGRNGLLYIALTLTSGGESLSLFSQIHVDNSP
ncbi:MAG: type II secretion system protein [Rhodocyclaceae bacterium]|nr:type II secretion system protein [Rhodocyclaceae bacterium]